MRPLSMLAALVVIAVVAAARRAGPNRSTDGTAGRERRAGRRLPGTLEQLGVRRPPPLV